MPTATIPATTRRPAKYYYEYCDLNSLVQAYLIQYLSGNSDAFYSSFFFYKDVDGLMYAGLSGTWS